jgi:hypothetical protein
MARIQKQVGVAIVDAGPRPGGRDETAQDRGDALGIDREFEAVELSTTAGRQAFAGLQLQEPLGIDEDGIGLDGGRGRDGARDDLALRHQAFHARVDQAVAELVEVEDTDGEHAERGKVQPEDTAGDAGEDVVTEEAAYGQRNPAEHRSEPARAARPCACRLLCLCRHGHQGPVVAFCRRAARVRSGRPSSPLQDQISRKRYPTP